MEKDALHAHAFGTYLSLRYGVVVLGFALPVLLWFLAGCMTDATPCSSMSATYYGGDVARNVFVGILFALGACLFLYKGFGHLEDWLLNLTGVSAVIVALVPTLEQPDGSWTWHQTGVVGVFATIALVCWFCASGTLKEMKDPPREAKFRNTYRFLGFLLVAVPLIVWLFGARFPQIKFVVEGLAIWIFSCYWLVKSRELKITHADSHALEG